MQRQLFIEDFDLSRVKDEMRIFVSAPLDRAWVIKRAWAIADILGDWIGVHPERATSEHYALVDLLNSVTNPLSYQAAGADTPGERAS